MLEEVSVDPQLKEPKRAQYCLYILTYLQMIQEGEEVPIQNR